MTDEEFYIRPEDKARSWPFGKDGLMRETREFFRAYIWARKSEDQPNARVGWCSNCEAFLDEDDMRAALKKAKTGVWHNADVDCPYCGRNVTVKEESRMRSYNSVFEDHEIAYIYRAQPDLIYIREDLKRIFGQICDLLEEAEESERERIRAGMRKVLAAMAESVGE